MILDKEVEINIVNFNKKYYLDKGYDVIVNEKLVVKVEDLQKGSHFLVNVKCDVCGKEKKTSYKQYNKSLKSYNYYSCSKVCGYEKTKLTFKEKYGSENIMECVGIKEKIKKTVLEKYGVEHVSKLQYIKDQKKIKIQNTIKDNTFLKYKEKLKEEFDILEYENSVFKMKHKKCGNMFNIRIGMVIDRLNYTKSNEHLCTKCFPLNITKSFKEMEVKEYIKSLNIEYIETDKTILNPKHLDIYIPSHNMGIEFDGLYWHSEFKKDINYHRNKTELCHSKGVQLLHIFEDDWDYKRDIVKSIIRNKLGKIENKIYARKCQIKEVKSDKVRKFLDQNHLQGFSRSKYKLGLYYQNELVSLMTFGYRKTNNKKEFELIRFCNKLNTNVIGASSKLFKHFINNYKIEESYILSYADASMFDGQMYKTLGFEFVHRSKPNYFWVVKRKREHRWKYNKQKLIKEGFDGSKTEVEIMHERGYYRIYGVGQDRYEYYLK